jgi:hypothetical protein
MSKNNGNAVLQFLIGGLCYFLTIVALHSMSMIDIYRGQTFPYIFLAAVLAVVTTGFPRETKILGNYPFFWGTFFGSMFLEFYATSYHLAQLQPHLAQVRGFGGVALLLFAVLLYMLVNKWPGYLDRQRSRSYKHLDNTVDDIHISDDKRPAIGPTTRLPSQESDKRHPLD